MYKPGVYVAHDSPIHKRDPRVKIIGVIALSIIILQVEYLGLVAASSVAVMVSQLARIPLKSLFKTLRPVLPFFFCLFLMYAFFTPGVPLPGFPLGPVQITYQGLYLGLIQVGRFLLLVGVASILTMTTPQSELTIGLERLLRPLRIAGISSHDVAMMVSLALRFIPTLMEEMHSISEAQLARGANFNPHRLTGKIKSIIHLGTPLSTSIFRRCDELVDAMEARGYHQGSRTYLRDLVLTRMDACLIAVFIIIVVLVLVWHP